MGRPWLHLVLGALGALLVPACASDAPRAGGWTGTMDTLSSGHIVVRNGADPLWQAGSEWQVIEEVRIGSAMGEGPAAFGQIEAFDVDGAGRIWVLDGHARQLIVFDAAGAHVRTVGRQGGGPGEFLEPVDVDVAPDGHLWVVDVGNVRISVFDTAGRYVDSRPIPTRFKMTPWTGGFDEQGRFYAPVAAAPSESEMVAYTLVRHDSALVPRDTLDRPADPVEREVFELRGTVGRIPFQGAVRWRLSREGTVLALVTDQYRLFELSWSGDTLRTITRAFTPVPVTDADREQLRKQWERYTEGGVLPRWWSRLPRVKPPVTGSFFQDGERNLWVERQTDAAADRGRVFDVFDREGRYLGPVRLPFALQGRPSPVGRDGYLYGVTLDDLDVQYVVKARIVSEPGRLTG